MPTPCAKPSTAHPSRSRRCNASAAKRRSPRSSSKPTAPCVASPNNASRTGPSGGCWQRCTRRVRTRTAPSGSRSAGSTTSTGTPRRATLIVEPAAVVRDTSPPGPRRWLEPDHDPRPHRHLDPTRRIDLDHAPQRQPTTPTGSDNGSSCLTHGPTRAAAPPPGGPSARPPPGRFSSHSSPTLALCQTQHQHGRR